MNDLTSENIFQIIGLIAVLLIGGGTLFGVFKKMKGGFGPQNLSVTIIILVAIFVMIAGLVKTEYFNNAIGILGAIVGYIFGFSNSKNVANEPQNPQIDQ